MSHPRPAGAFRFGRFVLSPSQRHLLADGEALRLEARAFDLLQVLVERAGQLVSKDELLETIWPGRVVEDGNLHVHVSALRKLVGKEAIETVTGHGYRFILPVLPTCTSDPVLPGAGRLPCPLSSFIGRADELRMLDRALATTRLLTLSGMGGAGKTRLAVRLGEQIAQRYPDGVRFVDLTTVAQAERIGSAVATALGVREEADHPIEHTLLRHLADRPLLLVLDNCEHLLDGCAALVQRLLSSCAALSVLVTSRERLGIVGELVVPVQPMQVPPAQVPPSPDRVGTYEALQLFVDRARQVRPGFRLDAENAAAITEICRRLDGIPLALELAAARVALLSVEQIRSNLDDRFRLLAGNGRGPDRHQTLLASLQSTFEHLSPDDQRAFQRLSVFEGGWTLAAAAAVGVRGDEIDTMQTLGRLVDKSLVQVVAGDGNEPRYGMLETLRHYGRAGLEASGAVDEALVRHLLHYLALARAAQGQLSGEWHKRWLGRLDMELPNLLAAHSRCGRLAGGVEWGLELAANLRSYWLTRGLFALGQGVFEEALARPGGDGRSALRGKTLYALGQHHYVSGQMEAAIGPLQEAYSIASERQDDETAVYCLDKLVHAYAWQGEPAGAQQAAEEQLRLAQRCADPRLVGVALTARGHACRALGRFDEAAAAFEEALVLFESGRDLNNIHNALIHVARASLSRGDLQRARGALSETIRLVAEMGVSYRGHFALDALARFAAAEREFVKAARYQGASDAAMERVGARPSWFDDAILAALRAEPRDVLGEEAYARAQAAGRALPLEQALHEAADYLGSTAS